MWICGDDPIGELQLLVSGPAFSSLPEQEDYLILVEIINTCRTLGKRILSSPDNYMCMCQSKYRSNSLTTVSTETSSIIRNKRQRKRFE